MGRKKAWPPPVRIHRGVAYVTLYSDPDDPGRRVEHRLGPAGSPEASREYLRLVAEYEAAGTIRPDAGHGVTVGELVLAWTDRHEARLDARELGHFTRACKALVALFADTPVAEFDTLSLEAVRDSLITEDLSGRYINRLIMRLRRIWKWGVSRRLVPVECLQQLVTLEPLRSSDKQVRWTAPRKEVSEEHVLATLPYLRPAVAAMVRVQLLTATRPGEVCGLKPCDIDREGLEVDGVTVWVWHIDRHKKAHERGTKLVPIGPQAQAVLTPYLERDPDTYCFSPRESMEDYLREHGRTISHAETRTPRDCYDTNSYAHRIKAALEKAERAGVHIPHWSPHQLRHHAVTLTSVTIDQDTARARAGHRDAAITRIYDHSDLRKAAKAAALLG